MGGQGKYRGTARQDDDRLGKGLWKKKLKDYEQTVNSAIGGLCRRWAVKNPDKELDELTSLFEQWNDANYLYKFFRDNTDDLKSYFKIERVSQAIQDTFEDSDALEELILTFPYTEELDTLFKPLDVTDTKSMDLVGIWKSFSIE